MIEYERTETRTEGVGDRDWYNFRRMKFIANFFMRFYKYRMLAPMKLSLNKVGILLGLLIRSIVRGVVSDLNRTDHLANVFRFFVLHTHHICTKIQIISNARSHSYEKSALNAQVRGGLQINSC